MLRARAGGLGAAAGPLIGGLVTSALSWRASFGLQVLVVAWIIVLARKITDPAPSGAKPRFDLTGAVLSAAGLFFVVLGLLQSRTYGFAKSRQDFTIGGTVVIPKGSISPVWLYVAIGALFLLWFFLHVRSGEKKGRDVLLPLRLFRNKVANLGLGTQTIQRLILQGCFFVVSVYLQEVNHYSPIQTGLILTPATIGILAASAADRFARRHPQRWLIIVGFLVTAVGMILLRHWRWSRRRCCCVGIGSALDGSVAGRSPASRTKSGRDLQAWSPPCPTWSPHSSPPSQPGPQDHHPQRRRLRLKRWAARYRSLVRLAPIFSAGGSGRGP